MDKKDIKKYKCAKCGCLRSENQGGKIFTVCDDCWEDKSVDKITKEMKKELLRIVYNVLDEGELIKQKDDITQRIEADWKEAGLIEEPDYLTKARSYIREENYQSACELLLRHIEQLKKEKQLDEDALENITGKEK